MRPGIPCACPISSFVFNSGLLTAAFLQKCRKHSVAVRGREMTIRRTVALFLLGILGLAASLAWAQSSRGTVTGIVTDSTGAVVSDAKISLKNLATNVVRNTTSNNAGVYRYDAVDLGTYELTIEARGFKNFKASTIEIAANRTETMNVSLQVGQGASETVTVEGSASLVALQSSEEKRGETINELSLKQLPIIGQNSTNLILVVPGAVKSDLGGSLDSGVGAVNGARTRSNNFLIDGVDNNDISVTGPVNTLQNNDAIQEVAIQTSNFSAEFGRAGGAVINQITKSGTNNIHGTAAWVYRSEVFDATTLPSRVAAGPDAPLSDIKPAYKENIPAFTVGGPVVIPGVYDGHNKTFFFVGAQWDRFSAGAATAVFSNVPTAQGVAVLQSLASKCPNVKLYLDSLAGITSPAAAKQIDISIPAATFAQTGSCDGTDRAGLTVGFGPANRVFPSVQLGNNHQVRIDHNASDKQLMSFRWLWNKFDFGVSPGTAGISPLFDATDMDREFSGAFTDTYLISSSLTNEFRFSYSRTLLDVPITSALGSSLPRFGVTGISAFGTSTTFPQGRVANNFQYQDTMAKVVGRHQVRYGVEFLRQLARQFAPSNNRGTLVFNSSPGVTALANFIDDFSGDQGNITKQFGSPQYYPDLFRWSLFIQDSWRVSPSFTLNAGLRYENFGQPANIFKFPAYSGEDPSQFTIPNKVETPNKNFGPALGFAWSPQSGPLSFLHGNGKMVIRGGYQLSYDTFFNNLLSNMAASAPNNPSGVPIIGFAGGTDPRGLAAFNGTLLSTIAEAPLDPLAGSGSQFAKDITNPRYSHYSLGIQRELPGSMLFDISYVGGLGRHLFQNLNTNPTLPNATNTGAGPRLNPAFGPRNIRASGATSNYNGMQVEMRRKFAQTPIGQMQFTSNYTWSRNMDVTSEVFVTNNQNTSYPAVNPLLFPNGLEQDYSTSDNDRRHVWNSTIVWDVRGPKNGFLSEVLGGWTLSTIIPVSSGQPYTVINGRDRDFDGSSAGDRPEIGNINAPFNSRAVIVPVATCASGYRNPDSGACTTPNDVRFVQVAGYNPSGKNTARRNALYTQGSATMHLNVIKKFRITEGVGLEYRAEIFNLLNNQNYNFGPWLSGGASTVSVTDAAPGNFLNFANGNSSETQLTTSSRYMRMGLKVIF